MEVKIINKSKHNLPAYATKYSAGMDIKADTDEPIVLEPMERYIFPTGIYMQLPEGTFAMICSRSGLACKYGIKVTNDPGIIDSDYTGEIKVSLINLSRETFVVNPGERIAQMIILKHEVVEWNEVKELEETERGEGGLGSTGRK